MPRVHFPLDLVNPNSICVVIWVWLWDDTVFLTRSQDSGHVWPFLVQKLTFDDGSPNHEAALCHGRLGRACIRLLFELKEQDPKLGRRFQELYSHPLVAQRAAEKVQT